MAGDVAGAIVGDGAGTLAGLDEPRGDAPRVSGPRRVWPGGWHRAAWAAKNPAARVRPRGAIRNRRAYRKPASGRQIRLPKLPKLADNAVMQADPPKADPPKRKRRWFQFSLRTLMIGVTLLAVPMGYVGWQARIVRERRDLLASQFVESSINDGNGRMSWIRRSLGDKAYLFVYLYETATPDVVDRFKIAFPEAHTVAPSNRIQ
jgi:hypothetical protein